MKLIKRLKSPVPKLIKKVQKVCAVIGGLGVIVTQFISQFPETNVPSWVWQVILGGVLLNHFILQLLTPEDFNDANNQLPRV